MKQKFKLDEVVMTKAIAESIVEDELSAKSIADALNKHASGDWGELEDEDKELNDEAVRTGKDRFLSKHIINKQNIYIITELFYYL